MAQEFEVSSLVVYAAAAEALAVSKAIALLAGAQIHALTGNGRIAVTLEAVRKSETLSHIAEIGRMAGVISVALVFHHTGYSAATAGGCDDH